MQSDCLTLREYEQIATKYLYKCLPAACRDNDNIGRVMEYMIRADLSYKPGIGTLIGRRMTYAQYAVKHISEILKRKRKRTTYSLDFVQEGKKSRGESSGANIAYGDELGPAELAELSEIREYIYSDELSTIESLAVGDYYFDKTPMKEIADKLGVTRMTVWLAIERGLDKLRKKYGEKESSS